MTELEAQKSIIEASYADKHEKLTQKSAEDLDAAKQNSDKIQFKLDEETAAHAETSKKLAASLADASQLRKTISERDQAITSLETEL